ncbi:MAG: hypothetical protein ACI8Y8_002262, partial [Planctomycetota bacterium]
TDRRAPWISEGLFNEIHRPAARADLLRQRALPRNLR